MTDDILASFGLRSDGIPADHPDADLLRAIRIAADLDCQREDAWKNWNARPARRRGTKKEAQEVFQQIAARCTKYEETVVTTRARTPDGARAKLRYVTRHSEFDDDEAQPRIGTAMRLPMSAIRDALAMLGES